MTSVEDVVKESFGNDCIVETNSQFLSVYDGDAKIAVINLLKHRMILHSERFAGVLGSFSEKYKKIFPDAEDFLVFASYK
jgi:hypothetical protein